MQRTTIPTTFVIIGGTGDLAKKKLIPSLFSLYQEEKLPKHFRFVGFSRSNHSDESYRDFVRAVIEKSNITYSDESLSIFLEHTRFISGLLDDHSSYEKLLREIQDVENQYALCSNRLFYLAIPPAFLEIGSKHLSESSLAEPCSDEEGWARILVEKPFGTDLETSRELDQKLLNFFKEDQIFRIDHYLAKNAVQNILSFRFSNTLFEHSWNKNWVEKVHIKLFEQFGVEDRGAFYDKIGALRDVGQNHMLQMLAVVAMENPGDLVPEHVRDGLASILKALKPYSKEEVLRNTVRGQYEGYKTVKEVAPDSQTETYFFVKVFIDTNRWEGVPFYLESGKQMHKTCGEIEITFKSPVPCICGNREPHEHTNILTFGIAPRETISVRFWIKKPGFQYELEEKHLSFNCGGDEFTDMPDAYEKVLYDAIQGDSTSFSRSDGIESAWKFITPILEGWEDTKLHLYPKESHGPQVEKPW